jgi:hypothetical protein
MIYPKIEVLTLSQRYFHHSLAAPIREVFFKGKLFTLISVRPEKTSVKPYNPIIAGMSGMPPTR